MLANHLILCGKSRRSARKGVTRDATPLQLHIGDGASDVHVHVHDITVPMVSDLPPVAADLLDLAAYVYCADQATRRGGTSAFDYGAQWRRRFHFDVAVRCPDQWNRPEVLDALTTTLGFLSDDDYEFTFSKDSHPRGWPEYLPFQGPGQSGIEEVLLFSGGLDSFAGALTEIFQGQRKVALVSHDPVSKVGAPQRQLVNDIIAEMPNKQRKPFHIPVEVNKGKLIDKGEFTQRSRSFLYAAVGAIVSRMFHLNRLRFYENGVLSFNLPISAQALGGRSSRTTHPLVLQGFSKLLGLLFETTFTVENPFLWKTKTEILSEVKTAGYARMCAGTISCAHTRERTKAHSHCGRCSQCIDRRLVAMAAGYAADEDPPGMYAVDVVKGPREIVEEQTLVERYVGTAVAIAGMATPVEFVSAYGEVARVLNRLDGGADAAAQRVFDLHKRHANQLKSTFEQVIRDEAPAILARSFAPTSMLGVMVGRVSLAPAGAAVAGPPTPTTPAPGPSKPAADRETFSVKYKQGVCELGNTNEFRFFERLARRPGIYVTHNDLFTDVWQGQVRTKSVLTKTASCLRRRLRGAGLSALVIDGSEKDNYRLLVREDESNVSGK